MENLYYNGVNIIDLAKRRKHQIYTVVSQHPFQLDGFCHVRVSLASPSYPQPLLGICLQYTLGGPVRLPGETGEGAARQGPSRVNCIVGRKKCIRGISTLLAVRLCQLWVRFAICAGLLCISLLFLGKPTIEPQILLNSIARDYIFVYLLLF